MLYEESKILKEELKNLFGKKYTLDCGHKVTFNHNLGASIVILNNKELHLICTDCYAE